MPEVGCYLLVRLMADGGRDGLGYGTLGLGFGVIIIFQFLFIRV